MFINIPNAVGIAIPSVGNRVQIKKFKAHCSCFHTEFEVKFLDEIDKH